MSEDFSGLRADVEINTVLPEFGDIETRARRQRRRQRFGNSASALGLLMLVLPALVVGGFALTRNSDQHGALGLAIAGPSTTRPSTSPSVNTEPVTVRLVAADGVDFTHLYGLTEVCQGTECDLQLISLNGSMAVPGRDIFRTDPHQVLTNERIVALTEGTVRVSATFGATGNPASTQLQAGLPPRETTTPVRPVQLEPGELITAVHGTDAASQPIPHQPLLDNADLVCSSHGWWATGTDTITGESAVAISRDAGTVWTVGRLGVKVMDGSVTLATANGNTVYALARVGAKLALFRSVDGGVTWADARYETQWGIPSSYGISVAANGTIQVFYVAADGDATFMHSTNGGRTFVPSRSPFATTDGIVAVPGGYVMLGADPKLSTDGLKWHPIHLPYAPLSVSP